MLKEKLSDMYVGAIDPQSLRELASISLESRNLPDSYFFQVSGKKLISPLTGRPIEDSIIRSSQIDNFEYEALQDIQDWAAENDQGLCFWLSPPHKERSPQGKIIVSELGYDSGHKVLVNRSILFDTTPMECLPIADQIQKVFGVRGVSYIDTDELRRDPILVNYGYKTHEWVPMIEQIITEQLQWHMVATGEDFKEVERTMKWAKNFSTGSAGKGSIDNYIGSNELSCPFAAMQQHSLEGKYVQRCGKCGVTIEKVICKGYRCENCGGVYEGC